MKILKRNIISLQEAEKLIEKYYEGETTVAEEHLLRKYLSGKNVPAQFEAEKAIFGYFAGEKEKQNVRITPNTLKWVVSIASAAAAVVLFLGIFLNTQYSTTSYAYVDGKKVTDKNEIRALAQITLENIAGTDEVENGLKNIESGQTIEGQLNVFKELEF
ncbi:MAG TPA: hypothetical protein PL115_00625 [Bacteroidales bacterium]|jgi:hypothetical protein|nr:hypothetical protein [Bacteroidales bacterium]HPY21507.1 hypothetical protein [Bacteroidales bacterium]HQP78348.1 hypothetical protein [Bacteroidales bacterium]